ncbi:MAG: type II secretion system F family protein [Thermoplasmatota archaeon]
MAGRATTKTKKASRRPQRPKLDSKEKKASKVAEKERKKQQEAENGTDFERWFLEPYKAFCYRALGERFDQKENRSLAQKLKQAGFNMTPGLFRSMAFITAGLVFVGVTGLAMLSFGGLIGGALWPAWALGAGVVGGGMTAFMFPSVVGTKISNRKTALEKELPFSLSELAVLASIGLSPIALIRRMAQRSHDPAMTGEFRKVVFATDVQGKDLITALAEVAKESPSPALRETFWDLANMMHQGGDLDAYLRSQSDKVLEFKREGQKQFIGKLGTYADMYVSVVLIGVMFLAVGAFMIDAFGTSAGGLSAEQLLLILTYGIVPLVVMVLGILLSTAYSNQE